MSTYPSHSGALINWDTVLRLWCEYIAEPTMLYAGIRMLFSASSPKKGRGFDLNYSRIGHIVEQYV